MSESAIEALSNMDILDLIIQAHNNGQHNPSASPPKPDPQKEAIQTILQRRKIKKLIHFTAIENLENIFQFGILPILTLKEKNIPYRYNDETRFDGKRDCICLSVEYPNHKMFYKYRQNPENQYAVVVLNAESILLNDCTKYYCETNAANRHIREKLLRLTTPECLENMFQPEISIATNSNDKISLYKRKESDPDFITTDPQAEILIEGKIETKDIMEIHFSNYFYFRQFASHCTAVHSNFYFKSRDFIQPWEWEKR